MKLFQYSGNCHLNKVLKACALPSISLVVLLLATILTLPSFASAEVRKEYYPSGKLESEVNLVDGKREGIYKSYGKKGKLIWEVNYINGKREGIAKGYWSSGKLAVEMSYKNGEAEKLEKWYYPSGELWHETNFKNGKKNGVRREYYKSGELKFRDIYKNDQKVHRTAYDEVGKRLFSEDYPYDLAEADTSTPQPPTKETKQVHSIATGFLFGSSGYILTNYHIVRGAKSIKVKFQNGKKVTAEVIIKDSQSDIAFLKPKIIPNIRTINLSLADSSSVRLGDKVFTLGYPIATVLGENLKYSEGVVNSLSGVADDAKVFQISIPTQSGNSGGPLFNERGEVIGIVSSSLDVVKTQQQIGITPQNVNFAIKSSLVKNMLAMLPENLISPTDLSLVQRKSKGSISNFVQQVENNIVLIEVE